MEAKWEELLSLQLPTELVSDWYARVAPANRKMLLSGKSEGLGSHSEVLMEVDFARVEKWVKRKRGQLLEPVATGGFDHESIKLSRTLDMHLDSPEQAAHINFDTGLQAAHEVVANLFTDNAVLHTETDKNQTSMKNRMNSSCPQLT